jgi:hypothetical protein
MASTLDYGDPHWVTRRYPVTVGNLNAKTGNAMSGSMARLTGRLARFFGSRWVGLPAVIVLLCLTGLLMFRQSRLAGVPDIGDPFDVDAWGHIDVDPVENAASDYETAVRLYRAASEPGYEELDAVWEHGWAEASPAVQTWLDDNRAALQAWRVGTEKNMHLRVQPAEMTVYKSLSPPVFECRALLRLAHLEAERLTYLGDTASAWEWHRACLRYSCHLGMNESQFQRTMGACLYCRSVDRVVSWARDDSVTSDQFAQALADVRAAWKLSSSPSVSIRIEYFIACDELANLEKYRGVFDQTADAGMEEIRLPPRQNLFLNDEPELTRRLLKHQVANLLQFADEPRYRQPDWLPGGVGYFNVAPQVDSEWLSPAEFRTALSNSMLGPHLLVRRGPGFIHTTRAAQGLMELLLAAEWFRRTTGEFPATVDELLTVPMLDEVPRDGLSRTETPLRYERDPDNPRRAKVWSVGEDGIDDGGSIEHVPAVGRPDLGFWIGEPESDATATE